MGSGIGRAVIDGVGDEVLLGNFGASWGCDTVVGLLAFSLIVTTST